MAAEAPTRMRNLRIAAAQPDNGRVGPAAAEEAGLSRFQQGTV